MSTPDNPRPALRAKHVKQLQKTEMCKFYVANRCDKGPGCAFAHSLEEMREKPNLLRTSMCRAFLQTGNCQDPQCTFAHCEQELRTTTSFYKTKLCRFASSGRCKHGDACRFAHAPTEINQQGILDPSVSGDADSTVMASLGDNFSLRGFQGTQASSSNMPDDPTDDPSDQSNSNPRIQSDSLNSRSEQSVPSDHSTRAEMTASNVPTPEGSGDSGQEGASRDNLASQSLPMRRGGPANSGRRDRRGGDRPERNGRHCTTVMLANVPNFLTQGSLVSLLEDLTDNMRGAFDFFYCPWDPFGNKNLGYAIINFCSRSVAAEFAQHWSNQPLVPRAHGAKRLRVVPAALQGRVANVRHFSGFSLAHHPDPRFRPLIRNGPDGILQPMAVPQELVCNNSGGNSQFPQEGKGSGSTPQRQQQHPFRHQSQQPHQPHQPHQQIMPQDAQWQSTALREQAAQAWVVAQDSMYPQQSQMDCPYYFGHDLGLLDMSMQQGGFAPEGAELGSGAETPEMENEHPLSRQVSTQVVADQLMGMFSTWNPEQSNQRMNPAAMQMQPQQQYHGQGNVGGSQNGKGGNYGLEHGQQRSNYHEQGAMGSHQADLYNFNVLLGNPGRSQSEGTENFRASIGNTENCQSMQPYWALLVPPVADPANASLHQQHGASGVGGYPGGGNGTPYVFGDMGSGVNNMPYGSAVGAMQR